MCVPFQIVLGWWSCSVTGCLNWPLHLFEDRAKRHGEGTHDGSVDILLTGCEVSLWLLEQFAADLAQVMVRSTYGSFSGYLYF